MAEAIDKKELDHLARLARIELDPNEEEKLLKDLGNILDHFKELQNLDTEHVAPMAGGTDLKKVFREDAEENGGRENTNRGAGTNAFPEKERGFLKIPPVFE
jgi:aspartyl-tRNA(Asn)/glutamyl-tRNA(Gln) amidotransferase subunit C